MGSFVIFGIDLYKVNWSLIFYTIFSIAITAVGFVNLNAYGSGRAVIWAIGATIVCVFFGLRWFSSSNELSVWPPTINMCPDYLSFIGNISGSRSKTGGGCVDFLGISTNNSGIKKIKQSELQGLRGNSSDKLFEYTAKDIPSNAKVSDLQEICNRCQTAGVTWEGVYDGDNCVGVARLNVINTGGAKCGDNTFAGDTANSINSLTSALLGNQ